MASHYTAMHIFHGFHIVIVGTTWVTWGRAP